MKTVTINLNLIIATLYGATAGATIILGIKLTAAGHLPLGPILLLPGIALMFLLPYLSAGTLRKRLLKSSWEVDPGMLKIIMGKRHSSKTES